MAKEYMALMVITHSGYNCYCGPMLEKGQEESFKGGRVWRGVKFDLDHLDDAGIAKLEKMGAVKSVGTADKKMSNLVDELVSAGRLERAKPTTGKEK